MNKRVLGPTAAFLTAFGIYGLTPSHAQESSRSAEHLPMGQSVVVDTECTFFGASRDRFLPRVTGGGNLEAGRTTRQFLAARGDAATEVARKQSFTANLFGASVNLIDKNIFAAMQANGVTPAAQTTDYEFIRRVTLDLTGRIPLATRVATFVASTDPAKRTGLVEELLAKPEWVDKWTMFYGDLYKNTAANIQIQLKPEGRNAFYKYIHDSITANKPYNQMATEIIAAQGMNSFDQTNGQMNYLPLGVVGGGPVQDIFDQQTANVADQFLGLAHVNCLLCHNGRGHLDSLSLWGSQTTRQQAWGLSAFMGHTHTATANLPKDPNSTSTATYQYWTLAAYTTDYALNTTTGNRPARQPVGTLKTITPVYPFGGAIPGKTQDYRVALAQSVTGDFQFARAAVNYLWAEFFGVGIVDPPDQFDPARLDPANPPPAPWTLQPSNPQLLNALAQSFIDSGCDLKALMRLIVNSDTYQLATDVPSSYNPSWDQYFARKFVRRLWSEEVHDSVTIATGILPSYTVTGFTADSTVYGAVSPGFGKISYAMQAPDVVNMPDNGGAVSQFEDTFLRGNRDDQPRKGEGSILQALGLMNDNFIQSRIHSTGTGATASFLAAQMTTNTTDATLINSLYLNVLSRLPSATEMTLATAELEKGGATARKTNAEDLLWTLFNKLDFVFNY